MSNLDSQNRLDVHSELSEQRDFLLASLDDLDSELEAGDISQNDYDALHQSYASRLAKVLSAIEVINSGEEPVAPENVGQQNGTKKSGNKKFAWIAISVAIAASGGLLVARSAGNRTPSGTLTGGIDKPAAITQDAKVQALLQTGRENMSQDPFKALKAFDEAASIDPTKVEAITYGGWILRIVAQQAGDDAQRRELLASALTRLNKAIETDPKYPDAHAFRGILLLRDKTDYANALADFIALDKIDTPDQIKQMTAGPRAEAQAQLKTK